MTGRDADVEGESTRWRVVCDECGEVEFDVLDEDWFGNSTAATWYAGYHGGKEHPEADYQLGMVEEIGGDDNAA